MNPEQNGHASSAVDDEIGLHEVFKEPIPRSVITAKILRRKAAVDLLGTTGHETKMKVLRISNNPKPPIPVRLQSLPRPRHVLATELSDEEDNCGDVEYENEHLNTTSILNISKAAVFGSTHSKYLRASERGRSGKEKNCGNDEGGMS